MANLTFNISLHRKNIDVISYSFSRKQTKSELEQYVKGSLVNHDGFDSEIIVNCVTPLTKTEYQLYIDYGNGFEYETSEDSLQELKEQQACYRENCPQYSTKIIVKRVSIFE